MKTYKFIWPTLLLTFLCAAVKIQAQPADYSPYVSVMTNTPNLLGYWRFDPQFQTNSYVNGYTGTNVGDSYVGGTGSGAPLVDDPLNQGYILPDGQGYLATDLFGQVTNQFTLMAWINLAAYPATDGFDSYYEVIDQQANGDDCDLIVFPSGQIYLYTDAGGGDEVNTQNPIPLNEWHFIAGTMTNGGLRCIYVDGQLVGANLSGNHHANPSSPLWIGYGPVFTPRHFVGSIDEAALFNRELTPGEIAAIYLASGPTNLGTLNSITLSFPAETPVGTSDASLNAVFSSGTNFDITDLGTYSSSDTSVITVASNGFVTAHQLGSATVTATYGGFSSSQIVTVVPNTAVLTHRYSFSSGNANDSVGTANGTLNNGATITGGSLTLNGYGYLTLPAGTINSNYYALSIEMWANLQRTPDGATNIISAFGTPGGDYLRLGTHDATAGGGDSWIGDYNFFETTGFQPGPVVGNVHIAGVWNPAEGQMNFYVDGTLANGASISTSLGAISSAKDLTNIIGANIDGMDGVVGTIQEYRIYNGPLSLDQIRASIAAGPANPPLVNNVINPGSITNVTVTTHPNFILGTIQDPVVTASSATVQNINVTTLPDVTFVSSDPSVLVVTTNNQVQAVGVGSATLTATYLGTSGQTTVTTIAAPGLTLTHRYSFAANANDSVSGENGTLMGNATASGGLSLNQENDGNGYGDFVSLPRDLVAGYPALTVESWVNLGTQVGAFCRIFSAGSWTYGTGVDASGIVLSPDYGNAINMNDNPDVLDLPPDQVEAPADSLSSTIAVQSAGLIQLVAVFDPDNEMGTLYYNGQVVGTAVFRYPLTSIPLDYTFIGKSGHVNNPLLIGTVNDIRVYYGAMTPGQVASNYIAGLAQVAVETGPAAITDQPTPQTVLAGSPANLTVGASGAPPLSYQWYLGGAPVAGATGSEYSLSNASTADAGLYTVQVSNSLSAGTPVVSQGAQLTVDSSVDLTNGLLVHLTFDNTYADSSGNGNDGQPGGSPTFIPGKVGAAVHLSTVPSATNYNYVSIPNSTSWSYAGDFSVAFWQRHTGLPNDLPMVGNAVNSTYQPGWVLTDDQGRLEASLNGGGFILIDPSPGPIINDGQWHHIGMVVNRELEQVELYIDGSEVYSQPLESLGDSLLGDLTDPNINTLTIGSDPTGTYGVAGQYDIDDFALWSRALVPDDFQAIYTLGEAGETLVNGYVPQALSLQRANNGYQIDFSSGILQSAPTLEGPWTTVTGATPPSYQIPLTSTNEFFRVESSGGGTLE